MPIAGGDLELPAGQLTSTGYEPSPVAAVAVPTALAFQAEEEHQPDQREAADDHADEGVAVARSSAPAPGRGRPSPSGTCGGSRAHVPMLGRDPPRQVKEVSGNREVASRRDVDAEDCQSGRMSDHDDLVRASFDRQVGLFSGPDSPFVRRPGGTVEQLEPLDADMLVLDVACGAAHASEVVAPQVRQVVGVDLTASLLDLGASRLAEAGVANVLLQEGNAQSLPFVDDAFDLVYCLNSLHHIGEPDARDRGDGAGLSPVRPRRGVGPPGAVGRACATRSTICIAASIRRTVVRSSRRSSSRSLPEDCTITYAATAASRFPVEIAFTEQSDRDGVEAALHAELAGGAATGFEPAIEDGVLVVSFWTSTVHASWPPLS